jgi:hypothetical protein
MFAMRRRRNRPVLKGPSSNTGPATPYWRPHDTHNYRSESGDVLLLRVHDDGRGGADFSHRCGLIGLKDRADALGGHLRLDSPPGA